MNRQEILLAARAECLKSFARLAPSLVKQSADALYALASDSRDYARQRTLLDAYGTMLKRGAALRQRLEEHLGDLTDRAIRTAYHNERSGDARGFSLNDLSLVESSIIEDDVKLGRATGRFHEKSGARIQRLNLRIASLFEKDTVKERENPFRPYLFARCFSSAANELGLPLEATQVVTDQLISAALAGVDDIYKSLDAFFESAGVAIRLPSPARPPKPPAGPQAHRSDAADGSDAGNRYAQAPHGAAAPARKASHKVEQLLRLVRGDRTPGRAEQNYYLAPQQPGAAMSGHSSGGYAIHEAAAGGGGGGTAAAGIASGGSSAAGDATAGGAGDAGAAYGEAGDAPPFLDTGEAWVSGRIVGQALKKLFAPRIPRQEAGSGSAHDGFSSAPTVPPQHSVYHLVKAIPATTLEEVLDSEGEIRNLIFEKRPSLMSKASDSNEMMTIDVVGMIFEFILRDPEVPAEVRAQLGRLQFLMLKIGLLDPQLLTDKSHPARQLINRIGTIAQGVKQNDPFGERLTGEIHRIVEALLADGSDNMVLVARLLEEFEAFVARELRATDEKMVRAVEAMEEAEKRTAYLAKMTLRLKEALAAVSTEVHLHTFLEKTWLRAIEKAEHEDPQLAVRYRQLVPDLVWSITDKPADQERSQLVKLLPKMIGDLKAGMESVKAAEKQAFLGWLIDRHTQAIKAAGAASKGMSLASIRQHFEGFTGTSASDVKDEEVFELDRKFIDDALAELRIQLKGMDSVPELASGAGKREAVPRQGASEDDPVSEESILNRLSVGVPVEIDFDGAPQQAVLNWMNKRATNMLLSLEGKDIPTMITVTLFRRLLSNGRARFLEVAPLFERAIAALLEAADKVDEAYH